MAKLWLSLMLLAYFWRCKSRADPYRSPSKSQLGNSKGSTAAFLLTAPKLSVSVPLGDIAVLPASLNFSASVPEYFQLRWYFFTGPHTQLILIVKADDCQEQEGTRCWKDSCEISIWKTGEYEHRVELSPEDASLVLWDTRVEDSGIYSVTLLALGVKLSANISLTVSNETSYKDYDVTPDLQLLGDDQRKLIQTKNGTRLTENVDAPMSAVREANGRDSRMSNIIQLTLAGVILCLLALVVAEHISFTSKMVGWGVRETTVYQATEEPTAPSGMSNAPSYVEIREPDELYCNVSS